jgi:hypothetical protein
MVKNSAILLSFENELIRQEPVNALKNFSIVDGLYQEAFVLGVFPPKNPLDGIEFKIRLAKALNSVH